jgi:multiple sugar transport system permease protein
MVNGGPDNSLLFYAYYLYQNAFMWFKMGYGSALAWVLFVIILLFTALVFRSSALWVYYETEQTGRRTRRVRKKRA